MTARLLRVVFLLFVLPTTAWGQRAQPAAQARPSLSSCTPRAFVGETICVCGHFPDEASRMGLTLDGAPLGPPMSASASRVTVVIPEGVTPGRHVIGGKSGAGFPSGAGIPIQIIAVRAYIAAPTIHVGDRTTFNLALLGTDETLRVRITHRGRPVTRIQGGDHQVLPVSRRRPVSLTVFGQQVGSYPIDWEIDPPPCPCQPPEETPRIALGGPREPEGGGAPPRTPDPDGDRPNGDDDPRGEDVPPDDGPRTVPRPPDEPSGEGDPPPERPPIPPERPPIPPEVPPEERESCCELREDGLLTFPVVTDPMQVPEVPIAPRDPAVVATQVILPTGAYAHNEVDLDIEAVGVPFQLTRHYVSDVVTTKGGLLGHRWDFSYNKRVVPIGTPGEEGLALESLGAEPARLEYFDGHGHGARYSAPPSATQRRHVLNFGLASAFEAFVTTYVSPSGAFHEIQRYVLIDPDEHPFRDHPDVDDRNGEAIFYVLREKNGLRYVFNCRGQLLHILHRNDYASLAGAGAGDGAEVRATLHYDGPRNPLTQNTMLSTIIDPSGHRYEVKTEMRGTALLDTNVACRHVTGIAPIPRISTVRGGGTTIRYVYRGTEQPRLSEVRFHYGARAAEEAIDVTFRYEYDGQGRLLRAYSPRQAALGTRGVPYIENHYDGQGRVVGQSMADEPRYTIAYDGPDGPTVIDAKGHRHVYALERVGPYSVISRATLRDLSMATYVTRFSHNADTQITRIELPRGNWISFAYDEENEPVTLGPIRNWVDRGLTYASDLSLGNLLSITRGSGTAAPEAGSNTLKTSRTYEPLFNEVASRTDARENTTSYSFAYDAQGDMGNPVRVDLPAITQPDDSRLALPPVRYTYTKRGQLDREIEGPHREIRHTYQPATGYLVRIDFPGGAHRLFRVDAFGRVTREEGSFGATSFTRDGRGFVVEERRAPGTSLETTTRFRYDLDGNRVATERRVFDHFDPGERVTVGNDQGSAPPRSDPRTIVTIREPDLLGRPTLERTTGGDGAVHEIRRTWDALGRIATSRAPSPTGTGTVETTYRHDGRGLLVEENRAGLIRWYDYDANGNPTASGQGPRDGPRNRTFHVDGFDRLTGFTDALGTRTEWTLDPNGNRIGETIRGSRGPGAGDGVLSRIERTYNEHDLHTSTTVSLLGENGDERTTETYYNDDLAAWRIVNSMGGVTEFFYDEIGRPWLIVDPVGNETRTTYDLAGRRTEVVEIEREWDYDRGSFQWRPLQAEYRTGFEYDELGRMTTATTPTGTVRYFYDSADHVRGTFEEGVGLVENRYDDLGRRVKMIAPGMEQTSRFAATGHLLELESPHAHTRWTYDIHGFEIATEDLLDGGTTTIERDDLGDPVEVTDPNGSVVTRVFNAIGLPTEVRIRHARTVIVENQREIPLLVGPFREQFDYDGLGRIARATTWESNEPTTRSAFRYDGLGQIVHEEQIASGIGQTLERRYAADGSWSEVVYPELAGQPRVRTHFNEAGQATRVDLDGEMIASYLYDGPDRVAGRSARNGTMTLYEHDEARRLTQVAVVDEGSRTFLGIMRATYRGSRLASTLTSYFGDPGRRPFRTETVIERDARGRPVSTITMTQTTAGDDQPARVTVNGSFTRYDGHRPDAMAEITYDHSGEDRVPIFARALEYTYDGSRVDAVRTLARSDFSSALTADPASVDEIERLVKAGEPFDFTQEYNYDANGNLVWDGDNVYVHDVHNRLQRVEQVAAGQWFTQAVSFTYDALGRRIESYPTRSHVPSGFVDWAPWKRIRKRYLYDGPHAIAEVAIDHPDADRRGALLARHFLGVRPGERIRMDRRLDEDPNRPLTPYYLHADVQGGIAFVTGGGASTAPRTVVTPPGRAGATVRPPDDLRVIQGTSTLSPYLGETLRIDTYAGIRYDEVTGRPLYDYRSTHRLADEMDLAELRTSIARAQNRSAIMLMAMMTVMYAPAQAGLAALINVGMAHQTAYWSGTPISEDELLSQFAEGALSGGLGAAFAPLHAGLTRAVVGNFIGDYVAGVGVDVVWRERDLATAATDNVLRAAMGAGIGTGINLGLSGFQTALRGVTRRTLIRRAQRLAEKRAAAIGEDIPSGGATRTGAREVAPSATTSSPLDPRLLRAADTWAETMRLLRSAGDYERIIADLIDNGHIRVRWDPTMGPSNYGEWHPASPNVIKLNPSYFLGNPRYSLSAASTIVHEVTHALGGGEISAHLAQAAFLHRFRFRMPVRRTPAGRVRMAVDGPLYKDWLLVRGYHRLRSGPGTDAMPLLGVIRATGYGVDRGTFYMRHGLALPHFVDWVRRQGGWGRILNLDPWTAYLFQRAADVNYGLTF